MRAAIHVLTLDLCLEVSIIIMQAAIHVLTLRLSYFQAGISYVSTMKKTTITPGALHVD